MVSMYLEKYLQKFRPNETTCAKVPQKYIVCFIMAMNVTHFQALSCSYHNTLSDITGREYNGTVKDIGNLTLCNAVVTRPPLTDMKFKKSTSTLLIDLYFYTILLSYLPVGLACDKYGSRNIIIAGSIVITLLGGLYTTVFLSSVISFILFSMIQGMLEAVVTITSINLVSHWTLKDEYTVCMAMCQSGFILGMVYQQMLQGILLYVNWKWIFFTIAITNGVFTILTLYFVYDNPWLSPFASSNDKKDMLDEIGFEYPERIPWKHIFKDWSVWAIFAGELSASVGLYFVTIQFKKFLYAAVGVDYNSVINTYTYTMPIPYFAPLTWALLIQYWVNRNMMPAVFARTFTVSAGTTVPFIFFLLATFFGCNLAGIMMCFAMGVAIRESAGVALQVNVLDVTRYYAGIVHGLCHGTARVAVTLLVQQMRRMLDEDGVYRFQRVVCALGGIATFFMVLYHVYASATRAAWDNIETEEDLMEMRLRQTKKKRIRRRLVEL